ncbi:MAG: metallophosphoesterase [Candidatus Pacearchaeota archaeon]
MPQTTLFPQDRIKFLENAILINDPLNKILVLADLHIGYEESIDETGTFPRIQTHDMITSLSKIFDKLNKQNIKLDKIIILGDLKHEHGKISEAEWRETLYVLDFISKKAKEIILIKGNHDNILGPIANKRNIQVLPFYKQDDILFMHGNKEYKVPLKNKDIKILILAHLHPAITLSDEYKREKYKCFLSGEYKKKQVYVLPSFNPITLGYDLITGKGKKEFLIIPENKLKNFNAIIYNPKEDKSYDFGKLKKLI